METERQRFWELDRPDLIRGQAEWDDDDLGEPIANSNLPPCPVDSSHRIGEMVRRPSWIGILLTSKRITDFLWPWYWEYTTCVIQDRVLEMFRSEGFTGFDIIPVKAQWKRKASTDAGIEIPILWNLFVTGWGGLVNSESGMRIIERCPGCGMQTYRDWKDPSKLIDENQWDGSDFFIVWPEPGYIFVSDRVAKFIRKHKLTGTQLIAPADIQQVRSVSPVVEAYGLRNWMPDDRAHELGDPLGIY